MLAGPLLDDCTDELLDGAIELLEATELLDFTELLEAIELLDFTELLEITELLETTELLAISELLEISELLAISELLETTGGAELSELEVLEGAALDDEGSVGSVPRLAELMLLATAAELTEDITATFEDEAFEVAAFEDETELAVLVGGFDPPLPPPHALSTTVRDKAVKALNVYKLMFSIIYLYCVMPYTKGEFIVSFKKSDLWELFFIPCRSQLWRLSL